VINQKYFLKKSVKHLTEEIFLFCRAAWCKRKRFRSLDPVISLSHMFEAVSLIEIAVGNENAQQLPGV